jgi:hypothetical protein
VPTCEAAAKGSGRSPEQHPVDNTAQHDPDRVEARAENGRKDAERPDGGQVARRHLERRGDAHEGRYQDEDGHGDHHDLRRERADVDNGR